MRKSTIIVLSIMVLLPCAVFARKLKSEVREAIENGAEAKIVLRVHDDMGETVANASVRVAMDMPTGEHSIYGKTDTNGVCTIIGKTNGFYLDFLIGKDGYYGSRKKIIFVQMGEEHDVKNGKWQPYGAVEAIELRKIRNPANLAVAHVREFNNTKEINSWIGFDLEKRDFVQPYGTGEIVDFEVYFDWDKGCFADYKGMAKKIRFTDKFSGYYQCAANTVSEFKGPYSALPDAEYLQDADFYERVIIDPNAYGRRYERKFFGENNCWVVRSRCKVDAEGKLVSAHYSVINNIEFGYGKGGVACICVTGAFNPTPNDTNLEDIETAKRSRHFIRQCEPPPPSPKKKRKTIWPF